ncbi:MAG: biotin transporter BioY [Clostridiales bacterium]|nr:biotin transporter BioY [Clostridiales bacterium]
MTTRRLVYIAVFTALIIVGGLISVPIPFTSVEVSLQTVFVLMAGLLLGARDGAIAVAVYLIMGLLGLPVFTKGGGIAYVFQPSFGYLIGFVIGAFLSGAVVNRFKKRKTAGKAFIAALVGMIPVYVLGVSYQVLIMYYYLHTTFAAALASVPAVMVLAVKDAVLCGLVSMLYPALSKVIKRDRSEKKAKRDSLSDEAIKY